MPLQISQNFALQSLIPVTVGPFSGAELSKSGGLDHLMSEATERGHALQQILDKLQQVAQSAETDKSSHEDLPLHGMLRG